MDASLSQEFHAFSQASQPFAFESQDDGQSQQASAGPAAAARRCLASLPLVRPPAHSPLALALNAQQYSNASYFRGYAPLNVSGVVPGTGSYEGGGAACRKRAILGALLLLLLARHHGHLRR